MAGLQQEADSRPMSFTTDVRWGKRDFVFFFLIVLKSNQRTLIFFGARYNLLFTFLNETLVNRLQTFRSLVSIPTELSLFQQAS